MCKLVASTFSNVVLYSCMTYRQSKSSGTDCGSWSMCASSQAVITNDLVLYLHYLRCTKLNIIIGNPQVSWPIVIVVETS